MAVKDNLITQFYESVIIYLFPKSMLFSKSMLVKEAVIMGLNTEGGVSVYQPVILKYPW